MTNLSMVFLAFLAGVFGSLQAAINAGLAKYTNSLTATWISFTVGLFGISLVLILSRQFTSNGVFSSPWYYKIGGLLGICFVLIFILSVPQIGVAGTTAAVIAGQLVMALILDHFGLFGTPVQKVDLLRLVGVGFLLVGVKLIFR